MSEQTKKEEIVVETTELNCESEKVGVLTKIKGFCKNHKKALIVGGALATAAGVLIKVISSSGSCEDDDCVYDCEDYVESDDEVREDDDVE